MRLQKETHLVPILLGLILFFLTGLVIAPPFAYGKAVSADTIAMLEGMMRERGMDDLVDAEALMDRHGDPVYAIGYSNDGYLIAEIETGMFMEQGGGTGPYSNNAEEKYYGGLLCYAENRGYGLLDPSTGLELDSIPYCPASEEMVVKSHEELRIDDSNAEIQLAVTTQTKRLSLANSKVRGVAFGNNGGDYENTCTAIAVSIALNYLDYTFDSNLVTSSMELENRTSNTYVSSFEKATLFHHYLVDECDLGPQVVLGNNIGNWGPMTQSGVDEYLNAEASRSSVALGLLWQPRSATTTINSIDHDIPSLISVWMTDWEDGLYENHTMAVYGYRELSDGIVEIAVHSGWYSSPCTLSGGTYYINEIWAPYEIAQLTYRFTLSDGWHKSGKGEWKYYEDETPVTGWKTIDGSTYHFDASGVRTTGYYIEGDIRYRFDADGVLVSQAPVSSPFTGPGGDAQSGALQEAVQRQLQETRLGDIPAALARAQEANPDVFAWLYVPGTNVNTPVARRDGDASFYLDHDSFAMRSSIGCAYTLQGKADLSATRSRLSTGIHSPRGALPLHLCTSSKVALSSTCTIRLMCTFPASAWSIVLWVPTCSTPER